MNIHRLALAGLAAAALLAGPGAAFAAKTLVYCSEGSPEGFNPQFFTTGTTADAASVPMYNRLVEFEIGTTNVDPRPGRELDRRARRPELHLQAAPRREVPQQREVHADARLQRRRRAVLVQPHGRSEPSVRAR